MRNRMMAALLLALCLLAQTAGAEKWDEVVGTQAPEIALTCSDGTAFSLYEALEEKELAVVCVFGSGCGACQKEMRALNLAYRLYQDQVAVVGLSLDRTYDTDEVLSAFAQEKGILFPLGRDPIRTAKFMKINTYPAFMIVDREGAVRYIEVNGPASIDHFVELFELYLNGGEPAEQTEAGTCTDGSCAVPSTDETEEIRP